MFIVNFYEYLICVCVCVCVLACVCVVEKKIARFFSSLLWQNDGGVQSDVCPDKMALPKTTKYYNTTTQSANFEGENINNIRFSANIEGISNIIIT